ncbi:MAG: RdgB/HAM1 family non-canonical purine NTP pyrophosphatase [Paracoccaceae bacterium]|nr:RdgB/HAM1 family non-canonical purine NTP pyrophosphatase [Paracoccaceae bacterium]
MARFDSEKLVLASHNLGKLEEIRLLLAPYPVAVISAVELGLEVPAETETTFAGNALLKAHAAAKATGLPALSDDSGIEVEALRGAPGVHTADWAETVDGSRDFPMAMAKVWDRLEAAKAPFPRRAKFVCVLAMAWPDGHEEVFNGQVEGQIVWPMRGEIGHGFDPIFRPEGYTKTFGEMERAEKSAISHRAVAFKKLVKAMFD